MEDVTFQTSFKAVCLPMINNIFAGSLNLVILDISISL